MKKRFLSILAIISAVCCLTACGKTNDKDDQSSLTPGNTDSTDNNNNTDNNEYDELNSMLKESYSNIRITVKNTFTEQNVTLESVYSIDYSESEITVKYTIERFSAPSLENPDSDVKVKVSGTAVIENGEISQNEAGITADIATIPLTFKEEYFENIELFGMSIDADVKNVSGFLGTDIACTDMHVNAMFLDLFYYITVTYSTDGHEIEYKYEFSR